VGCSPALARPVAGNTSKHHRNTSRYTLDMTPGLLLVFAVLVLLVMGRGVRR
jgi:hypothetical protein